MKQLSDFYNIIFMTIFLSINISPITLFTKSAVSEPSKNFPHSTYVFEGFVKNQSGNVRQAGWNYQLQIDSIKASSVTALYSFQRQDMGGKQDKTGEILLRGTLDPTTNVMTFTERKTLRGTDISTRVLHVPLQCRMSVNEQEIAINTDVENRNAPTRRRLYYVIAKRSDIKAKDIASLVSDSTSGPIAKPAQHRVPTSHAPTATNRIKTTPNLAHHPPKPQQNPQSISSDAVPSFEVGQVYSGHTRVGFAPETRLRIIEKNESEMVAVMEYRGKDMFGKVYVRHGTFKLVGTIDSASRTVVFTSRQLQRDEVIISEQRAVLLKKHFDSYMPLPIHCTLSSTEPQLTSKSFNGAFKLVGETQTYAEELLAKAKVKPHTAYSGSTTCEDSNAKANLLVTIQDISIRGGVHRICLETANLLTINNNTIAFSSDQCYKATDSELVFDGPVSTALLSPGPEQILYKENGSPLGKASAPPLRGNFDHATNTFKFFMGHNGLRCRFVLNAVDYSPSYDEIIALAAEASRDTRIKDRRTLTQKLENRDVLKVTAKVSQLTSPLSVFKTGQLWSGRQFAQRSRDNRDFSLLITDVTETSIEAIQYLGSDTWFTDFSAVRIQGKIDIQYPGEISFRTLEGAERNLYGKLQRADQFLFKGFFCNADNTKFAAYNALNSNRKELILTLDHDDIRRISTKAEKESKPQYVRVALRSLLHFKADRTQMDHYWKALKLEQHYITEHNHHKYPRDRYGKLHLIPEVSPTLKDRMTKIVEKKGYEITENHLHQVYKTWRHDQLEFQAQNGDAVSQCNLGIKIYDGMDVKYDLIAALKMFESSAIQKNIFCSYKTGHLYSTGLDEIKPDYTKALKYLRFAGVEMSYTPALKRLSEMYKEGIGVEQSDKWSWFMKIKSQQQPKELFQTSEACQQYRQNSSAAAGLTVAALLSSGAGGFYDETQKYDPTTGRYETVRGKWNKGGGQKQLKLAGLASETVSKFLDGKSFCAGSRLIYGMSDNEIKSRWNATHPNDTF